MNRLTATFRSRLLSAVLLASGAAPALASAQATLKPATSEAQALPSLAPLVDSVKSAVVNVDVQSKAPSGQMGEGGEQMDEQFMERFFGGGRGGRSGQDRQRIRQGAGSGFIFDSKAGLVLTNNHVIEDAVTISVRLDDGRTFDGEVVGRDPLTDVAVVRLKGKLENLPSVKLGDSDALRVGDWSVAIGNPFGLASSVSLGIISARARDIKASAYDEFLQTDAALNPGNSGGPLFNMKGEVIGINTAIVGGGTGIGFAVPSNLVKALLPQLQKKGSVTRAWLGIGIQDLTADLGKALGVPATEGAIVTLVNDDAPAKKAGIQTDDVVISIDGTKITSGGALIRTVALKQPGSTATLTLYRGGKKQDVKVQLGTRPDLEGISRKESTQSEEQAAPQRVGLSLRDLDARTAQAAGFAAGAGALITDVVPGSPAEHAGLAPGMVVVEASRKPVRSVQELLKLIRNTKSGQSLLLRVAGPGGARNLRALTVP